MTLEQRITALAQAVGGDIKALYETIMNPNFRQYQHQLFTSSGTWTVPTGVNLIWLDAVGGGDGGAGGFESVTSGGGGAGGMGSVPFVMYRFPVVPGETLLVEVGSGGLGGNVGQRGGIGGSTKLIGSLHGLATPTSAGSGPGAGPGTATTGGATYTLQGVYAPAYVGDYIRTSTSSVVNIHSTGGAGGAPGLNGGGAGTGPVCGRPSMYRYGGNAVGELGGGGAGGSNIFGVGAGGGSGGQSGFNAPTSDNDLPSYGGAGGGGGCNAAGGNGAPGMLRIYWIG